MPDPIPPPALAAEFDCLMARAGLTIPPDRHAAILASYADFRAQIALLHGTRGHVNEPSNVFSLIARGDAA